MIVGSLGYRPSFREAAQLRGLNPSGPDGPSTARSFPLRLSAVSDPTTLLLRETGIAQLDDGSEAVNVGPIVAALRFLTEGRGDDRGTDEHGAPLPDLLSLAFDVLQSIILGGRAAEYFRKVKQDFDAQSALEGRSSLALAKQATTVRHRTPSNALEKAATQLRTHLQQLEELSLDDEQLADLKLALQGFRDFGAERWVAATSHLLLALNALERSQPSRPTRAAKKTKRAAKKTAATSPRAPKRRPPAKAKAPAKRARKKTEKKLHKGRTKRRG